MNKPTPDTYSGRLLMAMEHAQKRNLTEIAAKIGVSPQTMQFLTTKGKSSTNTAALADHLGVSALWLEKGVGPMLAKTVLMEPASVYRLDLPPSGSVPLISWVQAGSWCEAIDNFAVGDAEKWLPCPASHGPRTFALRVVGDSMTSPNPFEKSYPEGTIIFVDPDRDVYNGARVVAKLTNRNEVTFKKYVEDAGHRMLIPLNPAYKTIDFTEDMVICAVLIGSFFEER